MPLACTLAAADQPQRIEMWASILDQATARTLIADGMEFVFPFGAGVIDQLSAAITSELACCSFFSFVVTFEMGETTMTVRALGHGREVVTDLFGRP